jgi:hypothetical protein
VAVRIRCLYGTITHYGRKVVIERQATCSELVWGELQGRIKDLQIVWDLYKQGDEDGDPDLGNFYDYGLCFDFVEDNEIDNQLGGYFRYQLSWGGPSDEFRFFTDEDFVPYHIEYWYLNWFDGAKSNVFGEDKELMLEIFEFFKEIGSVENEYKKVMEDAY